MDNSYGLSIANRYSLIADFESTDMTELLHKKQQRDAEQHQISKMAAQKEKQEKLEKVKQYKSMREPKKVEDQKTNDDAKKPDPKFNSENRGRGDRNNYRGNDSKSAERKNGGYKRETAKRENHRGDRNNYRGKNNESDELKSGGFNRENRRGDRNNYRGEPRNSGLDSEKKASAEVSSEGNDVVNPVDDDKQVKGNDNDNNGKRANNEKRYNDRSRRNFGDKRVGEEENTNNETANAEGEVEEPPKEPEQFTLDEWKAKIASRAKPQHKLRQAGEGEDQSHWEGMVQMKRKDEDEQNTEEVDIDIPQYLQRWGKKKHVEGIVFQFNDGRRSGGGRGRGGPRQDRGPRANRDGQRYGRFPESDGNGENFQEGLKSYYRVVQVENERDFPSLR